MNARTISLPDLVTEKRRNTALSLSEGFAGAGHQGSLAATAQNFAPRVGNPEPGKSTAIARVLPIYYRTRQLVLGIEKKGQRIPERIGAELRQQEKALAAELRLTNALFFQRFDEAQLDRLIRSMSFLRLSSGRWIFGGDSADWPQGNGQRAFILLYGRVSLFHETNGAGEPMEIGQGTIFGEANFKLCDESVKALVMAAAKCDEPCIIGCLTLPSLEAAFADRAFGNKRIAASVKHVPALARVVQPDPAFAAKKNEEERQGSKKHTSNAEVNESNAVMKALQDLSKVATTLHMHHGDPVRSDAPLSECMLIVSKGGLVVNGDVTLTEKLDAIPPRKVRIRVHVDRAEKLAGDSIFDKLDPYCIVKLGEFKRFQSPPLWNVGPNPKFDYDGVLTYADEQQLEFLVMDHDKFSADDLCGHATVPIADLYDGWSGKIELTHPKKGIFANEQNIEEPAGKLFVSIKWDFEKITALTRVPKQNSWQDQELFHLRENDCWGHEEMILGPVFKRTLEQASNQLKYSLTLDNIRVKGDEPKDGKVVVWKASKARFLSFVRHCGREKQFVQACRVSALEKQHHLQEHIVRLIDKWEAEEQSNLMRRGVFDFDIANKVEPMDPSRFRTAYRGVKAQISIRNALNLSGGGWFDKLDPYAIVRFQGTARELRTSVLQDAGGDPIWNCEGSLVYNGETALEVTVWDYDRYSADDKIAEGILYHDRFCGGFEGMVPLSLPGQGGDKKKKKGLKPMMIVLGIQWDPPRDPALVGTTTSASLTGAGLSLAQGGAGALRALGQG
jgi:hypothetical protein